LRFVNRPFVAAAIVLAIAMGVGRFVYTPLLVVMRADAGLSVAFAGVLASANLAGYLIGAFTSILDAARRSRTLLVRIGSVGVVATTAMMALPPSFWLVARCATGIASGIVFVLTTSLLIDYAVATGSKNGVAIMFSGVGVGIAGATLLTLPFVALGGSRAGWIGLAIVSALLLAFALPALPPSSGEKKTAAQAAPAWKGGTFGWLALLYGVEGAAYIVPATFLVAMIAETPEIRSFGNAAWVIVGLSAAPSTIWWRAAAARLGLRPALVVACAAQVAGMLAPFVFPGAIGAAVLAVSLGATFVGIVALSTSIARELMPNNFNASIGILTALYGTGQIVGPLVATHIALLTGSYRLALAAAAVALALAATAFAAFVLNGADYRRRNE
jgi:predicted MFS family arabinose efflux permease